ncbi:RadC family protein [Enhygromyxa salina]|nr:DNA repair protein RadC [Enhygromyxa salina]
MHLELVTDLSAPDAESKPDLCTLGERPRERMLLYGPAVLADVELIALLLGGGRALHRARGVLDAVGGLAGLSRACPQELRGISGIGDASATALAAAVELKRRIDRLELPWGRQLQTPRDAELFLRSILHGASQENFIVVGLDARQRVRLVRTVAIGTLTRVEVHPRELFRPLLRGGMHSCLLAHNHPSGDATPSEADVLLTERMARIGLFLGVPVLDHIVITDNSFVSLAELGLLPTNLDGLDE